MVCLYIGIPFTVKMNYLKLYVSTQRNLKDILIKKKQQAVEEFIQFDNVYSMLTNIGYVCGMFTSGKIIKLYVGNSAIVSPEERW